MTSNFMMYFMMVFQSKSESIPKHRDKEVQWLERELNKIEREKQRLEREKEKYMEREAR